MDYAWDALRRGEPWIWVDVMEFAAADILVVKQSHPESEDRVKARRPFACDILTVLRTVEDEVEHYDLLVATANNFQLHMDGFQVFRGEFPVKESTVDTLKRVYLETPELAEEIFNNGDAGRSVNDGRRLQLPFSPNPNPILQSSTKKKSALESPSFSLQSLDRRFVERPDRTGEEKDTRTLSGMGCSQGRTIRRKPGP